MNAAFEEERQAEIHYMSQPVLSTMMFNSEFPLGVEVEQHGENAVA